MEKVNYVFRETVTVLLKDLTDKDFLHPEKIRLSVPESGKKFPVDVGSLAYSKRKYCTSRGGKEDVPYLVDMESLVDHRRRFLRNFFEYISVKGYRRSSITSLFSKVRQAFNVVDDSGYTEFLENVEKTRFIYNKISKDLKNKVHLNEVKPRSAECIQLSLGFLISINYGKSVSDQITKNTVKIVGKVESTKPREIVELKSAYDTYRSIATGLTDFLLNVKPFPCQLVLPGYETYLFSSSNHRVTPHCFRPADVYNHNEGRLVTDEEYFTKRPEKNRAELRENLKRSRQRLKLDNLNPRAKSRRALAATAMQSYQIIFMMLTGAYVSEVSQLEFDSAFESNSSMTHRSYRAVKFRAAGRVVQYDLASASVALFKNYLRLREWILGGKDEGRLFFGLSPKSWEATSLCASALRSFQRKKIIGIFMPSDFQMLTARQFRKTKSLFLHEQPEVGRETVAQLMNHSLETNEQHYMETTSEKIKSELTNFWDAAHEAANHVRFIDVTEDEDLCRIAAGHCDGFHSPRPAVHNPPITPDCRTQYGCLYCIHYVCHANDKEDIHKLTSLLYIVNGVLSGSSDADKARELFLMLSVRVRSILHQIRIKSDVGDRLVETISDQVFKYGELTPYWENRLQRYEALGIVFSEIQDGLIR